MHWSRSDNCGASGTDRADMSQPTVLLDTNIVIGLLNGEENATAMVADAAVGFADMAISQITRMELLSFAGLTEPEHRTVEAFLSQLHVFGIDADIEALAIQLRRRRAVKLPDAIIAATTRSKKLQLLTLDKSLARVAVDDQG
jgi:predicted nucleic acid-binding protein